MERSLRLALIGLIADLEAETETFDQARKIPGVDEFTEGYAMGKGIMAATTADTLRGFLAYYGEEAGE